MLFRGQILLFLLTCGLQLCAQTWDTVRGLAAGERVQIRDSSGKQQRGALVAASADNITLETRSGQVAIERVKVRRVQIRSSSKRVRNIVIGAGFGVAVGAAIDGTIGAITRNETGEDEGIRAITYIAPIALLAGLCSFPAYRTIYRVP